MSARGYQPIPRHHANIPDVQMAHREIDLNDVDDRDYLLAMTSGVKMTSARDAWVNYRRIGEVHYSISRSARLAGYATLHAERRDRAGNTIREADSGVVADIVASIYSRFGGTRGLIERFYTLRKVPGEMYLTAFRDKPSDPATDGYWFLSPSEIMQRNTTSVKDESAAGEPLQWQTTRINSNAYSNSVFHRTIQPRDFRGRIWTPDGEFLDDVDTPMAAINPLCEMLHKLTESIMGRLRQRFILAGLLLIPSEINDAAISGDLPGGVDYGTNDKVLRYLIHIMTRNVANLDKAAGQLPIIMKGPAEVLEQVRHVIFESMIAETDLKLRAELIDRIMDGLDQQRGTITGGGGDGGDGNRFQAWSQADQERRVTIQPDLEAMCHSLTRMVLWRELRERNWEDARIAPWRVWYDLSHAAVKANMADEARQLYDRSLVGGDFLRKITGASDIDIMTPEEMVRNAGRLVKNPILMTYGLDGIDVDWEEARAWGQSAGPAPDEAGDEPQSNPGVGDPGAPGDRSVDDQTPEEGE